MGIRSLVRFVLPLCFTFALTTGAAVGQSNPPPQKGHRPPAEFDELDTPLAKAIKTAYRGNAVGKKDKMADDGPGGKKDKCAEAIANGNDHQIAQFCDDVGTVTSENFGGAKNLKHPSGKPAGKRLVTKTTLHYKSPKQKGRASDPVEETWPHEKLKGFERVKDHHPGPAIPQSDGRRGRSYGSPFLPDESLNDDLDCVDMLTGEHHTGDGCFDASGALLATLTVVTHESGTPACQHLDGSTFFGDPSDGEDDDCWDEHGALRTTLVALLDEDGPEALDNDGDDQVDEDGPGNGNEDADCIDGRGTIYRGAACSGLGPNDEALLALVDEDGPDEVDNDADGLFGEDPPTAHACTACDDCDRFYAKFGLTPTAEEKANGECDMSRAIVKFANDEAVAKGQKKIFKAKDDGTYDPDAADGVPPGKEEREMTITESFGVKCKHGTTYVAGVCIDDEDLEANGGAIAALGLIAGPKSVLANDADGPNIANVAMMGFTFAPPVIEWGYKIRERVCVFGICVEVFYARIGYEFDLAVGLRLPVEVEALDVPESVLAGEDVTILTQLEPLDFTTSQYEVFCHEHNLDSDWFIGGGGGMDPCRRFGFTNFLDDAVPDALLSPDLKDGDEFVARYSIFAGIQVRVLMIPIINWAIDSSLDLPAAVTMFRIFEILKEPGEIPLTDIIEFVQALMGFGSGTEAGILSVLSFVKEQAACGTFTTPFGREDDGSIRAIPISGEYEIRADCAEALVRGEVITINGQPRPLCTNMILGVSGASLGVGLGLEVSAGSDLIRSTWTGSEDAEGTATIDWRHSSNESGAAVGVTLTADNFDDAENHDSARISYDDFIYYLNLVELALKANLQFGGILSPIPDIGSFTIYRLQVSFDDVAPPLPQHPGTSAIAFEIPVENYGLELELKPNPGDPALLADADTLRIVPGEPGPFAVGVRNIGSREGSFDNFRIELSNRPNQAGDFVFGIDPNTDHDCRPLGIPCNAPGTALRGNPWDGIPDDCYEASGSVRADRGECINEDPVSPVAGLSRQERDDDGDGIPDEDPPDIWASYPDPATFLGLTIAGVAPYATSAPPGNPPAAGESLSLGVIAFRHPLTRPGVYPIRVTGDSVEAKEKGLAPTDPMGNARQDATDLSFMLVESFFEPQVTVLPNFDGAKPGVSRSYTVEGTNGGNLDDSMSVSAAFIDSNRAQCTLTTLGRLEAGGVPDCPYRAVPTVVPASWTTAAALPSSFPDPQPGQLQPLETDTAAFTIVPPRDWAGMEDTTYEFVITTVSQADPAEPAATRSFVASHTTQATKESMTRYISLEIAELITALETAEAAGVKLGGVKPIAVHPISQNNARALDAILAGDLSRASGIHSTGIHLVQAFVHALDGGGKGLPPVLFADLHARAAAILEDLAIAEASMVPSAP